MNTNINYAEIFKLHDLLNSKNIPHDFHSHPIGMGGFQITYPSHSDVKCSVILFPHSYGAAEGKLEIMGLLTDEEAEYDSVIGHLTAEDVFNRIIKDYNN